MARGINLISKMVADKKLAASDETLGSVYLLAVYENMTTVQRKGTFTAHQHGANALLQLRTIEQFYSNPVSASLYDVAYCQMVCFIVCFSCIISLIQVTASGQHTVCHTASNEGPRRRYQSTSSSLRRLQRLRHKPHIARGECACTMA